MPARLIPRLASLALLAATATALAQAGLGPRGFDADRPDIRPPAPPRPAGPVLTTPQVEGQVERPGITIRDVAVTGDPLLSQDMLREAVRPFVGRPLGTEALRELLAALSSLHQQAGNALVGISLPQQDFANGLIVVRINRGRLTDIVFEGDVEGVDLSLTRAYAEAIRAEQPLTRATLERNLLLMNETPGRRVEARLEPGDAAGEARLVLRVTRTRTRWGLGLDNLGAAQFGDVQFSGGITVNALIREGDSTRLTVGMPFGIQRFTYGAVRHQQPIGTRGLNVAFTASVLELRRSSTSDLEGRSVTGGVQFTYPLIRSAQHNLQLFGGLDILDSRTTLGTPVVSDEATRVFRFGATYGYTNAAQTRALALAAVMSQGADVAGARQRIAGFGDPAFSKVTLIGQLNQVLLTDTLVLRLRATAQFAAERLPPSELFTYGGVNFGRGFRAATLFGDSGVAAQATLAVPVRAIHDFSASVQGAGRFVERAVRGTEVYAFADVGYVVNENRLVLPRRDSAASAGFGIGIPVADETNFNLEYTHPLQRPQRIGAPSGQRVVFVLRRSF